KRWYLDCVKQSGLQSRCAGLHTLPDHPADVARVGSAMKAELIALARHAVESDGSDAVILAGAPLAGLAGEVESAIPALVIDPISVAVTQAVALAKIIPHSGFARRLHKPLSKVSTGLNNALAQAVNRDTR